ncbi:MAG: alkaline phosphatase family protein [Streptosporangiaceae bacterium]
MAAHAAPPGVRPRLSRGFARLKAIDDGPRDYTRYGFRVPAVIVSPYARPGYVCSKTLDHTSVLKLIEEKWNLPPLTRRDAAAESPLDAIDLAAEPAFAEPPTLPEPVLRWGSWGRQPRRQKGRTPTGHGGSHLSRAVTTARSG